MIYFHPGFLQFGSGHLASGSTYLSPSASLAKKMNIVFVSFNYRLDAFGFFPTAQFVNSTNNNKRTNRAESSRTNATNYQNSKKKSPSSKNDIGNYALYDQLTAVEWVSI